MQVVLCFCLEVSTIFTFCISSRGKQFGPSVCLDLWELLCAPPHGYRTMLCISDLCSAPPTCLVHHGTPDIFIFCSSVPKYTLAVHNISLYWLGGARVRYQLRLWCCTIHCCQPGWICQGYQFPRSLSTSDFPIDVVMIYCPWLKWLPSWISFIEQFNAEF